MEQSSVRPMQLLRIIIGSFIFSIFPWNVIFSRKERSSVIDSFKREMLDDAAFKCATIELIARFVHSLLNLRLEFKIREPTI